MKDVDIREEIILMRMKREDAKRTKLIQSSSSDQIEVEKIISLDRITEALDRITNTLQRIEREVRHGQ